MPGKEGPSPVKAFKSVEGRKRLDAQQEEVLGRFDKEQQTTILNRQKTLSALGYFIGKDFEIPIILGLPGPEGDSGWMWNQHKDGSSYMQVNAQDLAEKPLDYLRFVTSHEAGHRRITRAWLMPQEYLDQPAFSSVWNQLEDPRNNNFVAEAYPNFREQMTPVYNEMMERSVKDREMSKEMVGTTPRFQLAAWQYIEQWWNEMQGKPIVVEESLPPEVQEVLRMTLPAAQEFWWRYPSKEEAEQGEETIEKYATSAYKVLLEQIWPHIKTLIDEDMKDQETRKMIEKMGKEKGEKEEGIPQELEDMLSNEEKQELEDTMQEYKEGGKPVSIDSLSPELKEKIEKYIESLIDELRKELQEMAKEALNELEKELQKEMAGKIDQMNEETPEKGEEKKETKEKKEETGPKPKPRPPVDPIETKEVKDKLESITGDENAYEHNMREVLPVIEKLEDDLRELFVHRRAHMWETGFKFGKKLDIKKRMQEKAKGVSAFDSHAWQKREAPGPKDYAITLLVDLSGSMTGGEKIQETFKAVVALAEALNKLSIKLEIVGFNRVLHEYQKFNEPMSDGIRNKMGQMLREVGSYNAYDNDDGWALGQVSKRLAQQDEAIKILITLSDGQPAPSWAHRGQEFDLNKVVSDITKNTPQKLIGLGIGRGTGHVANYYPNSIANVPVEEMAEKLADLIRTVIEDPESF